MPHRSLGELIEIFKGSDAERTRALYEDLLTHHGPAGEIAVNLFRAAKTSTKAKIYRRGRTQAYDRKDWSLRNLPPLLTAHAQALGIEWGWAVDDKVTHPNKWVMYIDLPTGEQVSFHIRSRGAGPHYPHPWDGRQHASGIRICSWIAALFSGQPVRRKPRAVPIAPGVRGIEQQTLLFPQGGIRNGARPGTREARRNAE